MQPLKKKSLVNDMIKELFEFIDSTGLKAGDKLPSERELMNIWKASRTSVREAMKALEFAGVISIKRGDGTYLNDCSLVLDNVSNNVLNNVSNNPLNSVDKKVFANHPYIKQIFEARIILELQLLPLAIERINGNEIKELEQYVQIMEKAKAENDHSAYTEADISFHLSLAGIAKNVILVDCLRDSVFLTIRRLSNNGVISVDSFYETCLDTHGNLLNAVKAKDTELAKKLLSMNIRSSAKAAERLYLSGNT